MPHNVRSKDYFESVFIYCRWYLATEPHKAGQKHLYVSQDPTTDDPRRIESYCITCELGDVLWSSRFLYGNCTHFNAIVSKRKFSIL